MTESFASSAQPAKLLAKHNMMPVLISVSVKSDPQWERLVRDSGEQQRRLQGGLSGTARSSKAAAVIA